MEHFLLLSMVLSVIAFVSICMAKSPDHVAGDSGAAEGDDSDHLTDAGSSVTPEKERQAAASVNTSLIGTIFAVKN